MICNNDILEMENLASCEKMINRECPLHDINFMVMPGILQDKHKNVDPEKGIPTSRRRFNLIYIILDGVHDVYLGADYHLLRPNDLVIVPENMVYASKNVRNCTGYCLHFRSEFLRPLLHGTLAEQFPFFDLEANHIIHVAPHESLVIQKTFCDIIEEYGRFSNEKENVLKNLIHILLLRIRDIYGPQKKVEGNAVSRSAKLCNRFKHLAEKNFLQIREVKRYAEMLNITPQYLSDVVKGTFGRSPRKMINEMLTLEAKVLLGSTDKNLSEIAYLLRFDDEAHFSHFIKIQTGYSPSALRKNL